MTVARGGQALRRTWEILGAFGRLGVTSFGGPVAHLGYFRHEFVERRKWLDDAHYADLVALCQFLPGPASSQVGFAIGLMRGGFWGAVAAFVGFTLPSALMMIAFAFGAASIDGPLGDGVLHGLKLVAVAVVAHALFGMARSLCPDKPRAGIALLALFICSYFVSAYAQIAAIGLGALLGLLLLPRDVGGTGTGDGSKAVGKQAAVFFLSAFLVMLLGLPLLSVGFGGPSLRIFHEFFQAGALVFGGGHVVLPLLESQSVGAGLMDPSVFLAGYGAAQAMPGPLFTFAGYLGAAGAYGIPAWLAGLIALAGIFLPGFLLVAGALPFWKDLRALGSARALLAGANGAVVGVLAAAFYAPVWTSAVREPIDFALAVSGFLMLAVWRLPPLYVVLCLGGAGVLTVYF
ncbi:chromate efflux transporter [Polycladidibacter hongkongensis]|uniref:chromate efflux transporter n=1 Tax=Polycladidibacter hongkongensis TaxID=1647556 RepID=UPI00082E9321|nr:chromate efflux transporter [Pseudovibrio hongkongensis]